MFMRNVFIAAVSLQALVEGVLAQDKVTLTKTVTKKKHSSTAQGYDEVTVIPTSYITDGTTLWVDETVTIPCSRCTASSTAGDADAEATSEVTIETEISTVATDSGSVIDQTAEVTVVPTSYVTDGTTIWVDETVTIPCSKCQATATASTAGDADAEATSEATTEADAETTAVASDSGFITEQTADITTVVPTSYITRGTTRFVNETITIPCTKCAAKTKTPASEAAEETTLDTSAAVGTTGATQDAAETSAETSAPTEEETTGATQDAAETSAETSAPAEETTDVENGTQTANTATDEAEASTETETPIPTTINLSTGYGQNTVVTSHGPFANTTVPAGAETTAVDENPSAVTSEAATSSAVVSKVNKPVIIVIREVTIFHRTVVIGAACPPVKAGNGGKYIVGTGSDEKSFTEVGEALSDACSKQFKACSANAGKDISVDDCQKQLTICLSDASSTAKAPTPITKASTETASIIVPSDAAVTGETKSYVGGHVVVSTRTLTVSESCVISDGTPVVEGPTETGAQTTETGAAETNVSSALAGETTEAAEPTETEAATGSETGAVESSEAVTIVTLTKSNGEVSTTALTLTNGVPTGTGSVPSGPEETEAESSADAVPTTEAVVDTTAAAETTAAGETEVSSALGGETTEAGETVTGTATGVVIITMTKSDGEVSTTAVTLTNGVPTGTGAYPPPNGGDATTAEAPAETSESAIGQDTTLPVGDKTVTKTVTNKVTETVTVGKDTVSVGVETVTNQVTETVTVPCGAGGQTANIVTSVVTACPAPTTLATTPVRTPETVYVTATVEAARLQSAEPAPQRFRRMLGLAW
ncbi:hypothetical protein NW762_003737 [Fusarium torreyae]|uniref:Uncharacterized protein n=1 Tax=Fusarium torreyae TaxID=1237075 RepID=A0A9W8S9C4_9HYPO|nr:hypothetical protein NW762_003737 [Fusarium torreyae]